MSLQRRDDPIIINDTKLFKGAVMDTGAQKSVIGMKQAAAYCRHHKFDLPSVSRRAKFRFGDTVLPSRTMLHLFFPTPGGLKIVKADVVDANISLLIGLETLDE